MEFVVKRGAPLTILLDDVDGLADTIDLPVAKLRPIVSSTGLPDPKQVPVANFAVSARAADGPDDVAGWWLRLTGAQTKMLKLDQYAVDALLASGGVSIDITDPVIVRVQESATVND